MSDHDPFNEPESAHPRARELMREDWFWDCVDEESPFGSDEGNDAYYEFRAWRSEHQSDKLTECLAWIMQPEQLAGYSDALCTDAAIEQALDEPQDAFLADSYDMFTLDATVIATALGQLLDEGRIDPEAKAYVHVAIQRQLHPKVVSSAHRHQVLLAVKRVVDQA